MNKVHFNDFSHLGNLENVNYSISENQVQFLEILDSQGHSIQITIPDGIFEWFVDVFDRKKNKIHSDWTDHYDSPTEILIAERQSDIERFVNSILNGNLRFEGKSLINDFYKV
jgi:hypothetical protein